MAFENPLLKPSQTRKAALAYLFSDPEDSDSGGSVVDKAFNLSSAPDDAAAIALNIANNNGEYNPNDKTDYSLAVDQNPGDAWKAFDAYGKKAISIMGKMGLPFASSISAAVEQNLANKYSDMINAYVGPQGGQMPDQRSPFVAGLLAAIPFVGGAFKADNVESLRALRDQFSSDANTRGYFAGGVDPGIGKIVAGTVKDYNTLSPDAFGEQASKVQDAVYGYVTQGYSLDDAQNLAAIDFGVNYQVPAVAQPISETGLQRTTTIDPMFAPSFTRDASGGLIYADPSAVGPQQPNEYVPGLFTNTPVPNPVTNTGGGGTAAPALPSPGSYWTDAAGNPIRSGDGGLVYSGSATQADRDAGANAGRGGQDGFGGQRDSALTGYTE